MECLKTIIYPNVEWDELQGLEGSCEIVLGCMNLHLELWVEEPIPTMDNLQEVKIEKWECSNRICLMIKKRSILEASHERKLDSRIVNYYFVGYAECSRGYTFYDPISRSFFETGNVRILGEVDFEKEENIRNVVFEEESVNNIGQVLVPITIQEKTRVIGDNIHTNIPNIVLEQDYDEIFPQTPIKQPQQCQEVSLRRSIRERRPAISDDYTVFLQEHEDDIGLTKDDPFNFY
ncbi:hypothetical protein CR513_47412, partial [Mucuna pruriens]